MKKKTNYITFLLAIGFLTTSFTSLIAQVYVSANKIGGTANDSGEAIAMDGSGNVYITGNFQNTVDFDPGAGTTNLTSAGGNDIFVCKFNVAGNLVWAKNMGGTISDNATGITVDGSGNVYIVGYFGGTADFDPGAGTANLTSVGSTDIFVCKLDAALGNYTWAKSMGGTIDDYGNAIAVDALGNVYTTGTFQNTVDFDPDAGTTVNLTSAGLDDIFVSKLDASGNFVWAKNMGGSSDDVAFGMALDGSNNVCLTGYFNGGADFNPDAGTAILISSGSWDVFVCQLNVSGSYVWAKKLGGTGTDNANKMALDASGNIYLTGAYESTADFDPGAGTANLTSTGVRDIFVCKLTNAGNYGWAKSMGGTGTDIGNSITLDASGNVYTTGRFQLTADFDPSASTANLTSAGDNDIFVCRLNASGDYVWAVNMGGTGSDNGFSIAVDGSMNVFTTGIFNSTADFDPSASTVNLTSAGLTDIFLSKLNDIVLPVELLSFTGKNTEGGNLLTWTTANEVNNTGFQVERLQSTGSGWEVLGFVPANGKVGRYEYMDNTLLSIRYALNSMSYYRLRQMGNDGTETLSKVISISSNGSTKLKVYPNPVSNTLTVDYTDLSSGTHEGGNVQIFNLLGKQVLNHAAISSPLAKFQTSSTFINVSALPQGTYVLKVGAEQVKFVKQ